MKEEVVEKGFKEGVEGNSPDEHILHGWNLRSRTRSLEVTTCQRESSALSLAGTVMVVFVAAGPGN